MRILHLTKNDYKIRHWSGGTTTEVFIWPENACYATRDFQLRISSATVDLPESDFTPLPGVIRYIVPLQGSFILTHPGGAPVAMDPLCQPYRFSGGIHTHCAGKATDFNLMLKGIEGQMHICQGDVPILPGLTCLYAPHACRVFLGEQADPLLEGDSLVVFNQKDTLATTDGTLICCQAVI